MKTRKYTWFGQEWEFYSPKPKKLRQGALLGLIGLDLILPLTFGAGIVAAKLITKYNPLFLYR